MPKRTTEKRFPPLPNLDDVDLRLLRIFLAVVRNQGFSAAQLELNINQPTISTHMAQLEVRLGVTLCYRGRRGFQLTAEGELVHEAAQRMFSSIEQFRSEIGSARGQLVGELHIGVVDATVTNPDSKIEQALRDFSREAENVEIILHIKSPQSLQRELMEERLHIAIAPFSKLPSKLSTTKLVKEKQTLYCSKRHKFFSMPPNKISQEMLSSTKFVARSYLQNWSSPHSPHFNICAQTGAMEAIALLINTGEYIGYLPSHYAAQWVEKKEMRPILEDELSYHSQFVLAYRNDESNLSVIRMLEHIKASFG